MSVCDVVVVAVQSSSRCTVEMALLKVCVHGDFEIFITTDGLYQIQCKCSHDVIATKILHSPIDAISILQSQSQCENRPLQRAKVSQDVCPTVNFLVLKLPDAEEEIISMKHKQVKKLKIRYRSQGKQHWAKANVKPFVFFDPCRYSLWTLLWILLERVWKRFPFITNSLVFFTRKYTWKYCLGCLLLLSIMLLTALIA